VQFGFCCRYEFGLFGNGCREPYRAGHVTGTLRSSPWTQGINKLARELAKSMTDGELEMLLDDIESDRTERKESPADKDKIHQTVCAFANDLPDHQSPGVLFVGVEDGGKPVGLQITDQLLQNLASMRNEGKILPFPSIDVQKRTLKGCEVAVVIVYPSAAPPVRYNGSVWIRSGPRRGLATADDERRLNEKRRHKDLPADLRPLQSADLEILDELIFKRTYLPAALSAEVLEQNQRTTEHQLIAVRFASSTAPVCPTVLGTLVVGKSPTDWLPGAYIQFVRFDGVNLTDPVRNQKELRGALPQLLSNLDDLLRNNIETSINFRTASVETRTPDYPLAALQQIVRNSVLHRTYENTNAPVRLYWFTDRVEIQNPGGPYGQVTRDNFGKPGSNDYRNPNLAAVMKELGYVQRFGIGIAVAREEMTDNGNPPPEFQVEQEHVAVILRKRS
jgi:ATP-dependent DNA helicase RecG